MWNRNALSERLNLEWPILQAPMGDFTTPALAAGVSNAGGLGGLGMFGFSAEDAKRRINGFRQQSGGSLNVNYLLWPAPKDLPTDGGPIGARLQELYAEKGLGPVPPPATGAGEIAVDHLAMLADAKPEAVSVHFGLPDRETVSAIKDAGCYLICSATTVAEARSLEADGADAIIAQGAEAGGHRGTFSGVDISQQAGLFALLPQVVRAVSVPVIAAGGIADGHTIAAAIMLGASGVQLGTAFLRCAEAKVPDVHRAALATADDASTLVTHAVTGKPARMIRNRLVDEMSAVKEHALPFPAQLSVTKSLAEADDAELTTLYCGQSASLTREMLASELVATLGAESTARLNAFVS